MRSADLIIAVRRSAGLSQEQLAARLGRPQSTIARWETGHQHPPLETVIEVAHACGRDLSVGLPRFDDSYDSLIAKQLRMAPGDRVRSLAPPYVAQGFDVLDLLGRLAGQVRFVVVGAVAGALQGWPIMLGWRTLEIVPAESSLGRIEQLLGRLAAEPVADDRQGSRGSDERNASRRSLLPSGGKLRVTLLPRGTRGYADLARDAETMEVAPDTAVRVASLIDLIRIAEAAADPNERSSMAALWATLEMQHRRQARAASEAA